LNKGKAQEKWNMIGTFNRWLLFYALFDFSLQLLYQLPIFEPEADFANIGLNKIWSINHPSGRHHHKNPLAALTLKRFQESILDKDQYDPITGLQFQPTIFYQMLMNCIIISVIFLQCDIFDSFGYKKFIEQEDGSLDLLVQLSEVKSKAKTFIFNNLKIR
jgi:hypothetical protein